MKPRSPIARCARWSAALLLAATNLLGGPATAQGWRAYQGYEGTRWSQDYGVIAGRCDTAAVRAVLKTVAGIERPIAILFGSTDGSMLGAGRDMDATDRACIGQALELAPRHRTVRWANPQGGGEYALTPVRDVLRQQRPCREFQGMLTRNGHGEPLRGTACRAGGGAWHLT